MNCDIDNQIYSNSDSDSDSDSNFVINFFDLIQNEIKKNENKLQDILKPILHYSFQSFKLEIDPIIDYFIKIVFLLFSLILIIIILQIFIIYDNKKNN